LSGGRSPLFLIVLLVKAEDSDSTPVPYPNDSGGVQVVSGHGFQLVVDEYGSASAEELALGDWSTPPGLARPMHSEYSHPMSDAERMSETDQRMLEVEGHEAVLWGHFGDLLVERGEHQVNLVEMRRDEERLGASGFGGMVGYADFGIDRPTTQWWPVEAAAITIGMYFRSLPISCR
jgi:hypothetical protein